MRRAILAVLGFGALALAACASEPLPPPQASLDGIQAVRKAALPPMAVGQFTPAPGKPAKMDRSIQVRADAQPAPPGGYAKYLGDTLAAQLQGGGKLDPNAAITVSGVVTQTHVDSDMPVGHANLAARFTVKRDGAVVYDKELAVDAAWESDFMGVVAIPDAFNHYTGLFPKLVQKLLSDPEFIRAVGPR